MRLSPPTPPGRPTWPPRRDEALIRLSGVRFVALTGYRTPEDAGPEWVAAGRPLLVRAFVSMQADTVIVEVHDQGGLELVTQALEAARQHEPGALFIEGPYVSFAVSPPVWFGRVRLVEVTAEALDTVLPAAACAAVGRLRAAGLELAL